MAWKSPADPVWARRAVVQVFFASLVLSVATVAGESLGALLVALETQVRELGWIGPALLVLAMSGLLLVLVPESMLAVLAGAVLGPSYGLICVFAASVIACSVAFLAARGRLRERVRRRVVRRPLLMSLEPAVATSDVRALLLARLTPLQPAALGYVQGLSDEARYTAMSASFWGLLPQEVVAVYLGVVARRLTVATQTVDPAGPAPVWLIATVAVALLAMLYITRLALHKLMDAPIAST